MQLSRLGALAPLAPLAAALAATLLPAGARAEDKADVSLTWFNERRGNDKSLSVYHPQVDLGVDLGDHFSLSAGYQADVVTGATFALYRAPDPGEVDVVSSATEFKDTRHVGKGGLQLQGRRSRLAVGYVYGTERDYRSHAISASGAIDLPGKNTTFSLSYSHNFDRVCDFDNGDATPLERRPLTGENACFTTDPMAKTLAHEVTIDTTEATLTQNVSPTLVLQLGVFGQIIDGFQSNPYRRVRVAGVDAQENTPLVRDRLAVFLRLNLAFPSVHSALGVLVRATDDTWGVESVAAEMTYSQYLGSTLVFRFRGRAYQQDGAVFFRDAIDYMNFGPSGTYFTGDRELAPMRQVLVGGKLSYLKIGESGHDVWGGFDEVDFSIRAEAIYGQSLTDTAPGGDAGGLGPDMFVISTGLMLRY
jgi:hypothetical protein